MTLENRGKRRGFSFIEVLLAMALISFLLSGTAELVIRSISLKKKAEVTLQMVALVSSKLECLKSLPYESGELQAASYNEILEGRFPEVYLREWMIEDISSNMKRIELTVYPENHPEKTLRISLFLSRELGF
jgi:prepilin-type N-terminal cleavage/methylation domain-containing protein